MVERVEIKDIQLPLDLQQSLSAEAQERQLAKARVSQKTTLWLLYGFLVLTFHRAKILHAKLESPTFSICET